MSFEMNTMTMTMPAMPQGPVTIQVRCFEATDANMATLRTATNEAAAAAAGGARVTATTLLNAGMKAKDFTFALSTKVKAIRADLAQSVCKAPIGEEAHLTLFAMASSAPADAAADPLITLVDELTVEEMLGCAQMNVEYRGGASLFSGEVCMGGSEQESEEAAASSATIVLFYKRDTALGSACCLCACLAAMCATICCCCVCCSD